MPLNDSNFLMWFNDTAGETQFTQPLPRPFVREPEMYSPVLWVCPGDTLYFYYNSLNNTALPAATIQVQYNTQVPVNLPVNLTNITFPDGQHTYGSVTMLGNVITGLLRLVCGNLKTQWIWMTDPATAAQHTALVKFRNPRRLQNLRYGYLPADFYQQFRIRLSAKTAEPEHNKEIYTDSATGKDRGYYSEPKWVSGIETPDYDLWGHRAVASLIEHDEIYINGLPYSYFTAYKANMVSDSPYSTGQFELHDETYSTLNRS